MPNSNNTADFNTWWKLLRPHTLTAAFVPVLIGTALAKQYTDINILLFLSMLLASILIQAATNIFNEYYDFKRGLDTAESIGIGGTIVRDGVNPKTVLNLAFAFLAIATVLGIYICAMSSWWLAIIGLICMLVGYTYTGGPYPIAYTPFGEIFAGFFMGVIIILISFFIQTDTINLQSILFSIPIMILIGAILMSNNIRDLDGDKKKGRRTLAILLGKTNAVYFLRGMFILAYLWIIGLIIFKFSNMWILLVFLSIPKAYQAATGFLGKNLPIEMMPAMQATAQTNTFFGLLLALGIFLS